MKKILLNITMILATCLSLQLSAQDAWPKKPIRIVVPTAPGVAPDIFARLYANELTKIYKEAVVVDNKPGAAALLGVDTVAKAPADGHTLLYAFNAPFTMNPHLYSKLPYDAEKDFEPITQNLKGAYFVVTSINSPHRTMQELLTFAKANPDKVSYASYGIGSAAHLAFALIEERAGLKALHVPYKLSALPDVMSGVVTATTEPNGSIIPFIQSGQVRALAYLGSSRHPLFPELPTVGEIIPGYQVLGWHGFWVKNGTPKAVIERLSTDILKITRSPEMVKKMAEVGFEPSGTSPAETAAIIQRESADWGKLIRSRGIKVD